MNRRWRSMAWGMVIGLAWNAPCLASESLVGLLACRDVTDAAARLACFDREVAALAPSLSADGSAPPASTPPASAAPTSAASASAAPASTTTAAKAPAHPVLDPQQQFGLPERAVAAQEIAAGRRAAEATKVEAHVARVAPAADGRVVFTLDNDQVWRQLAAEGDLLAKEGDAVTVSRGLLGSYWLQLKSGRGCKVTRLR
jgi:hypothetical protein